MSERGWKMEDSKTVVRGLTRTTEGMTAVTDRTLQVRVNSKGKD